MAIPQIPVQDLARRLSAGEEMVLLDVREPFEVEYCQIGGSVSIPMGEIPARIEEIPRDRTVVIYCHHGIRSQHAAQWLETQGFERLENLQGGIDAWSLDVDPEVPRYA